MTDEGMAEEYEENAECVEINDYGQKVYGSLDIEQAYLAGLKAGRPKWHALRKDPSDLPKDRRNVWITYINGYHETETTEASFRHKYWIINGHRTECDVIAWCEIPKLEEVDK